NPERVPAREDDATVPTSPYGSSKLMTEIMLRDAAAAHGLRHVTLRYFNVAGADVAPAGRPRRLLTSSRSRSKPRLVARGGFRPCPRASQMATAFRRRENDRVSRVGMATQTFYPRQLEKREKERRGYASEAKGRKTDVDGVIAQRPYFNLARTHPCNPVSGTDFAPPCVADSCRPQAARCRCS